jgi:hypothetical protein
MMRSAAACERDGQEIVTVLCCLPQHEKHTFKDSRAVDMVPRQIADRAFERQKEKGSASDSGSRRGR